MAQVILKKSSVAARVPVAGDLAFGELALNYTDGLLYFKKADGTTIGNIGAVSSINASTRPTIRPSLLLDFANTRTLDPRITFARASTATFYDATSSAVAEQNLFLQSQTFSTVAWLLDDIVAIQDSTAAPDGTTTAETLTDTATNSDHRLITGANQSFVVGLPYTFSIFAKNLDLGFVQLAFATTSFSATAYASFDLSTGVLGTVGAGTTAVISSAGSGWYRCSITVTASASASAQSFMALVTSATSARGESYIGTGKSVYAWGAQLEQRSTATAYTPTTTAAITNYIPVLQTAASGVARFDCNPVTRESLGLLIEESRTNLVTYSAAFDNAAWAKTNATITTAAGIAPDGTQTVQNLIETATSAAHSVFQGVITVVSGTTYTLSFYAKRRGRDCQLTFNSTEFGSVQYANFDLTLGTVSAVAVGTATITPVGNSFYRCTFTAPATSAGSNSGFSIILINTTTATRNPSYTGGGYSGLYIWGAQLEAGSFATSYIPTVASQVTRAADSASMTGTNFSSWYGASAGTVYSEFDKLSASSTSTLATIYGGNNTSAIEITITTTGVLNFTLRQPSGTFSNSIGSTTTVLTGKAAVSFGANTTTPYVGVGAINGSYGQFGTGSYVPNPNMNSLYIGNRATFTDQYANGHLKRIAYYPVALTSTELIGLTS